MELIENFNAILKSFNIRASCVGHSQTDNYFYYDLKLETSGRVKDVQKYSDEISLALKTPCKPTVKVLHNEGVVRLEFVSPRTKLLKLFDMFTNRNVPQGDIMCLLGQSIEGRPIWMDLAQNPHMIVAGTTGSGKSTVLHNIIANLINYNDVNVTLIDPKNIEFSPYDGKFESINVIYSYADALKKIQKMNEIMEDRYSLLRMGTNSVNDFQKIVIIIDEFADLIMQDNNEEFYRALCRLAQKCRAAKIHIILSTQRPSVNIINGTIKANFPARIACRVASHVDSKVVLDTPGAERLLGKGDALLRDSYHDSERFQVAYTDAFEVCSLFGN